MLRWLRAARLFRAAGLSQAYFGSTHARKSRTGEIAVRRLPGRTRGGRVPSTENRARAIQGKSAPSAAAMSGTPDMTKQK